jgi:hypothetical protein
MAHHFSAFGFSMGLDSIVNGVSSEGVQRISREILNFADRG